MKSRSSIQLLRAVKSENAAISLIRGLTNLSSDRRMGLPVPLTSPNSTQPLKKGAMVSTVKQARVSDSLSHVSQNRRCLQWFYDHPAIDVAADKASVRLTPATILYTGSKSGDEEHIMKMAQYLQKELPVRVAHRVASFRRLPFMVGCNPLILAVHELYIRTFYLLQNFPAVSICLLSCSALYSQIESE